MSAFKAKMQKNLHGAPSYELIFLLIA